MVRKYGKKASEKIARTMREWKSGELKSGGSGKKVTSQKQAIAIGIAQARRAGYKVPKTAHHSTKYQPKYGNEPGAWESGFKDGKEAILHETRPQMREILKRLHESGRTDYDRGMLAAYEEALGDRGSSRHASRKRYPYVAYWVRSRGGPRSSWDVVPIYVLGTTTRADEGIVGHDLRVRPLRLGKGTYTMVVAPDDVEEKI